MPTPTTSTFDLVPPRRPTSDDFNGVAKADDAFQSPNVQTMFNAGEWNFVDWMLLAVGRVMPAVIISVTGGTSPSIAGLVFAASGLTLSNITTFTRTSIGNVLIGWAASTFPPTAIAPKAFLNGGPGSIWAVYEGNGVRVKTYDATGTAADLSFTVELV